jgi:hypothetical protein
MIRTSARPGATGRSRRAGGPGRTGGGWTWRVPAAARRWPRPPQERVRVERPVQQDEHARAQQGQQPPGHGGLVPVGADPSAAPSRPRVPVSASAISRSVGYPAKPHPVPDPAQPPAVTAGVGDLERVAAVEGDRAQPGEPDPRRPGWASGPAPPRTAPSRRRAEPAAQIPQRLLRRARQVQAGQPGGQLGPDPGIAQPGVHPQRQQEVDPDPGRQIASRRCTVLVCSRMSSTSSNGRYCVNSPRWPGANTPAATVTACVMVVVAD